jgi:hypothetical protein
MGALRIISYRWLNLRIQHTTCQYMECYLRKLSCKMQLNLMNSCLEWVIFEAKCQPKSNRCRKTQWPDLYETDGRYFLLLLEPTPDLIPLSCTNAKLPWHLMGSNHSTCQWMCCHHTTSNKPQIFFWTFGRIIAASQYWEALEEATSTCRFDYVV